MDFPYSRQDVFDIAERLGHRTFADPRGYDLNIIGFRTSDDRSDTFNDWVAVAHLYDGRWDFHAFPATTDPGRYYINNPENVKGTAVVQPGQYRGLWEIGKHRGRYDALVQRAPIDVTRYKDSGSFAQRSGGSPDNGMFGINLHRAGETRASTVLGKWSAGCQVLQSPGHFDLMMWLARQQVAIRGYRSFSYTLIDDGDLK